MGLHLLWPQALWWFAPLAVGLIWIASFSWPDRFSLRELERWRKDAGPKRAPAKKQRAKGGSYREAPNKKVDTVAKGAKQVAALPSALNRAVVNVGLGRRLGYYELVPKLAYVAVVDPNLTFGSEHQTVVCKLEEPGPTFTARPLPIIDGARAANDGVAFKKHADFTEQFLVEGEEEKRIAKWLIRPLREALLDLPEVWLRVDGDVFTLTHYGRFDADLLGELVAVADVVFAEYGAGGGPSLISDEENPAERKAVVDAAEEKAVDEGEEEDLGGDEANDARLAIATSKPNA